MEREKLENFSSGFGGNFSFLLSVKKLEPGRAMPALTKTLWFIHRSIAQSIQIKSFSSLFDRQNNIGEINCFLGRMILQKRILLFIGAESRVTLKNNVMSAY